MPVKLALFTRDGDMLPLHLDGQTSDARHRDAWWCWTRPSRFRVHRRRSTAPVPSLLRGFSAPVILECDYAPDDLALLLAHDVDGFNRWEAGQQLAARAYEDCATATTAMPCRLVRRAGHRCSTTPTIDDALLADLLTPPGEIELAERETRSIRSASISCARTCSNAWPHAWVPSPCARVTRTLAAQTTLALDAASQARRRLKRRVLELLALLDPAARPAPGCRAVPRARPA